MHWIWKMLGYASPKSTEVLEKSGYNKLGRNTSSRLGSIRKLMHEHRIGFYIVSEQDEHRSEYVADADRRIRYVSGFPGSAAFVTIGSESAELATDSRYYLIAERQSGPEWSLRKQGLPGVKPWDEALVEKCKQLHVDVGVDPRFIDAVEAQKIANLLKGTGQQLLPISTNLIDAVWEHDQESRRPSLPSTQIFSLGLDHTGKLASDKVADSREDMRTSSASVYISASLEDNAWLSNLRGGDVPYVPIFKSFIIVTADQVVLYIDKSKLPAAFEALDPNQDLEYKHEGVQLQVRDYTKFFHDLSESKVTGPVWVPNEGSWAIERSVRRAMTRGHSKHRKHNDSSFMITNISPINQRKAIKNCAEIAGMREAQLKCSVSIVRYLSWLGEHVDEGINEYDGGLKLLEFRETLPDFMGNSFETISAAGPNASAPHYAPESSGSAIIKRDQVYLSDSGSQFLQGSTDITRTTHYGQPTDEEVRAYTLVSKGQLAVSSCVFPQGTSGYKLDILARQFLWEEGLDYGHGTGHGIGSFLNIHESPLGIGMTSGPESISRPGHFVSDEPGFYAEDRFGVRLENDILVVRSPKSSKDREYYTFETLTLVPYEPKLIDVKRSTAKEKAVINAYHSKCREYLGPYLKEDHEKAWSERCTVPIV